ncbi:MAG: D-aminoacylase [Chloroflexota bacterium]
MQIDTLILNGRIVDGTGNPWRGGDIALSGERIVAITPAGRLNKDDAKTVIDATGMVVCPGFVDMLSHSTLALMYDPRSLSKVTQGVTTEIMGEGWTPAPHGGKLDLDWISRRQELAARPEWLERIPTWTQFRDWLEAMVDVGVSTNVGSYLGGGTLRRYAMGMEMGHPSEDEKAIMRRLTHESMEQGAMGVSYALVYAPSAYSGTEEIVDVCKVASQYDGVYVSHLRSEGAALLEALDEALHIGQEANLPVEIYHLKAAGKDNWPKLTQLFERVNNARTNGQDVTADMYPYHAMGTGLMAILPPWTSAGGNFYKNLRDPEMRAKIIAETMNPSGDWEAMASMNGPDSVMPIGLHKPENLQYIGKPLTEIADTMGTNWVDAACELALSEEQFVSAIFYTMSEDNVRRKLQQPWITVGTDAGGTDPEWGERLRGPIHPRTYGSYPRILGKYVRDEKVLPLEEAIRKMSSAGAQRFNLRDRGLLHEGYFADVVIFDPETIADKATYADSHQLSLGVRDVWVNGTKVLDNGTHTGATPGQIVQKR